MTHEYCSCGATIAYRIHPADVERDVVDMFWQAHDAEGHAPCDQRTAARARARSERDALEPTP